MKSLETEVKPRACFSCLPVPPRLTVTAPISCQRVLVPYGSSASCLPVRLCLVGKSRHWGDLWFEQTSSARQSSVQNRRMGQMYARRERPKAVLKPTKDKNLSVF